MQHESGNCRNVHGASGEYGCFQWLTETWNSWSIMALGYIAKRTPGNETYVAQYKIQMHLNQGHDEDNIARIWNQGNAGQCVRGVNSHGVRYDSCAYERAILSLLAVR